MIIDTSRYTYDPSNGLIYRDGKVCCSGALTTNGYKRVRHWQQGKQKEILAHRLAWFLYHGSWPDGDIDHIDGDRTNNIMSNMRVVDRAHNLRNAKRRHDNTSGVTGVGWDKKLGKWIARIKVNYKTQHLGCYERYDDAVKARKRAEIIHGFHCNHGR